MSEPTEDPERRAKAWTGYTNNWGPPPDNIHIDKASPSTKDWSGPFPTNEWERLKAEAKDQSPAIVTIEEQPTPHGTGPEIAPLVIKDIEARIEKGIATYGEPLRSHNGRSAMRDMYEELLDAAIYCKQVLVEHQAALDTISLRPGKFIGVNGDPTQTDKPDLLSLHPTGVISVDYYKQARDSFEKMSAGMAERDKQESILEEAQRLVHGERGAAYGHPLDDMSRTAGMLTHLLADKLQPGVSLNARDVSMMMVCVKLSRERNKPKRDNRADGAGYFETMQMIMEEAEARGIDLCR